jgi:dual specificity MAP kinase phosphatase
MPHHFVLHSHHEQLRRKDFFQKAVRDKKASSESTWASSPAASALRNLLSSPSQPSTPTSPAKRASNESLSELEKSKEFIVMQVAGSCRRTFGQTKALSVMADRTAETVYFLRKLVEGRDRTGIKRKILVYCQDGYTETSIIILAYIMSSLAISLPEAYLYLQNIAKRSFFIYPGDKQLLIKVDAILTANRKKRAGAIAAEDQGANPPVLWSKSSPSALAMWKLWSKGFAAADKGEATPPLFTPVTPGMTVDFAKSMLSAEEKGGSESAQKARVWFNDKRFEGFPSRILPFLYLGNL